MYDNINTYYKNTKIFINEISAPAVIKLLKKEEEQGLMTAEKYAYLSKAYIFIQNDKLAHKYAKLSVKTDKNYPYGYIRLAFYYARAGKKRQALRFTQMANRFDLGNNSFLMAFIATLYRYCDKKDIAENIISDIKHKCTKSADYYYNLGFIYSQEEAETAIKYLKQAEEHDYKDKLNLWYNLAENYHMLNDDVSCEFYINKCLKYGDTFKLLGLKADIYQNKEKPLEAIRCLRRQYKLAENKSDKALIIAKIIYNYSNSEQSNKCKKYIDFALKNFNETYALYYTAGTYYETSEDYEKALDMYKHMLDTDDKDSSTYSSISYCYSQLGDNVRALKYADKAIEIDPEDSYVHYRKGRIYTNMKEYNLAIESYMKSIDYDKTDVDSFQWISYCYSMLNENEKSLEFANRAILLNKNDSYSYFRKAWAYQEMGKYNKAIKYYQECIKYNDKYVDAYLNISYIYSQMKDMKQSLLYANKALLINKEYAYAHYRKAWALQECGKLEEAYDGYSKAIELDPTDIYNYLGIACISLNNNESSNALLYANKAIFIDRNCGGAYYYKSLALSNLGKIKEAEKAYAKAMELGYNPG